MNKTIRKWNYENIDKYMEVYINTPMSILEQRDKKGLYSGAKKALVKNVVGVDIAAELPEAPELTFGNSGDENIENIVIKISDRFNFMEGI
jgi:adenylylsulfate kinase